MNIGVLVVLTVLVASGCGQAPTPPPDEPGPFGVGYEASFATDPDRDDRTLPLHLWYPTEPSRADSGTAARYRVLPPFLTIESDAARSGVPLARGGPLPLVVFSHGYPSFGAQSPELTEQLASHGYIVAALDHKGSTLLDASDSLAEAAERRVPDVSFLIDHLLRRSNEAGDLLDGRVDPTAIAVVGNSFGGSTAMGVAAGWAGAPRDPRVRAIVPISGVFEDPERYGLDLFDAETLASVTVPVLLVGATEDQNVPIEHNEYAYEALVGSSAVYRLDVVGANHYHFAGVCAFIDAGLAAGVTWELIGSFFPMQDYDMACSAEAFPVAEASRLLNLYTVAFLKWHLEGDARYARYLEPGFADGLADVRFLSRVGESP